MTYLYEYTILDDNIKVEYTFSTVTDGIKVVDMWVDGKDHSVNWMGPEARAKLMARLENDFTNRMCGTTDDEPYIYDHSIDTVDPDEPTDLPGFEGTMEALEDLVDGVVGEPEFLGGR